MKPAPNLPSMNKSPHLRPSTIRRISNGVKRFTRASKAPFLVSLRTVDDHADRLALRFFRVYIELEEIRRDLIAYERSNHKSTAAFRKRARSIRRRLVTLGLAIERKHKSP